MNLVANELKDSYLFEIWILGYGLHVILKEENSFYKFHISSLM